MIYDLEQHRTVCEAKKGKYHRTKKMGKRQKSLISESGSSDIVQLIEQGQTDQYTNTTDFYMLLDVSSSMSGRREANAKNTMSGLFDVMDEHDRISIVTFDTKAYFKLKPRSVGQIRRQNEMPGILDRIYSRGATAIWDAIYLTVQQIENKDKNRKTLVLVLTDGQDNSSKHSYQETLDIVGEYPNITLCIVHIDGNGSKVAQYEEMCKGRGEYVVIQEDQIIVEVTRVFKEYYVINV
jgi:uncharacterized protein with von Willebrand factor type A (vWA) domain